MAQEKLPDAFSNSMLIAGIDESVQLFNHQPLSLFAP